MPSGAVPYYIESKLRVSGGDGFAARSKQATDGANGALRSHPPYRGNGVSVDASGSIWWGGEKDIGSGMWLRRS